MKFISKLTTVITFLALLMHFQVLAIPTVSYCDAEDKNYLSDPSNNFLLFSFLGFQACTSFRQSNLLRHEYILLCVKLIIKSLICQWLDKSPARSTIFTFETLYLHIRRRSNDKNVPIEMNAIFSYRFKICTSIAWNDRMNDFWVSILSK